jgi:hypothetical protein
MDRHNSLVPKGKIAEIPVYRKIGDPAHPDGPNLADSLWKYGATIRIAPQS